MADSVEGRPIWKYLVLQSTEVPSLICDLIVLAHFIRHWKKEMLRSPHNHAVACLIVASCLQKTIDVPFLLYYLRWSISMVQSWTFCITWSWLDYSLISLLLHVLAWFSIERHLFVFHSQLMKKRWPLILFHYLPLFICTVYAPLFYLIVIFFPTKCVNTWIYSQMFCGGACYVYNDVVLSTFDWLFHYAVPVLIVFLANVLLFMRVIWNKLGQGRPIDWRRHRSMILQLFYLSALCLTFQSPAIIVGVIQILWLPTFAYYLQTNYLFYLTYFLYQFLPIVIMSSLPELHKDVLRLIFRLRRVCGQGRRIRPRAGTMGLFPSRDRTLASGI